MKNKMTIEDLGGKMDKGFKSMDKRFNNVDQKFAGVGQQFGSLVERIAARFDKIETIMEHNHSELSGRFTSVERRTTILESK